MTTTWLQAHQAANLVAAQAHGDLGVDPSQFPIDVYAAIDAADVTVMWRPLPRVFGVYVNEPGARPGILLNNQLEPAVQRHTAAHELGHHCLGHGRRIDVDIDPFATPRRGWPPEEKAAEAFAVWFLMPRRAVLAALDQMNLDRPRSPEHVYQLSLLLGTSYRSTARHLVNVRLVGHRQSQEWMRVPPNRIKNRIDPGPRPASRAPDVWLVDRNVAGRTLPAGAGDRFLIDPGPTSGTLRVAGEAAHLLTNDIELTAGRLVLDVPGDADGVIEIVVGTPSEPQSWTFRAAIEQPRQGPFRSRRSTDEKAST